MGESTTRDSPARNKDLGGKDRFDLRGVPTYHTRPMSQDWSRQRDIDLLADEQARIDFAIPLVELPRIRLQLAQAEGTANGHASFERVQGTAVAEVQVTARVMLTCQRCLAPVDYLLQCGGRVAMVADDAEADRAPAGLDTILAPDHRISARDLAEEELLLSLPIVPLHDDPNCARKEGSQPADPIGGEQRHRPFERLEQLLKRRE
jgi:uncharacterized protein